MSEVEFDEEGEKVLSREVMFEEMSHRKFCEDIYDRIDIIQEHAECVSKCLHVFPVFVKEFGAPLTDMGNGLKLELASLRGNLGLKDLTRPNVPPGLWNVIETGFDSISSLESKRIEDSIVIAQMEERLGTCEEASLQLLTPQPAADPTEVDDGRRARSPDKEDEGVRFARQMFGTSDSAARSSLVDKNRSFGGDMDTQGGVRSHGGADCDENAELCSRCFARMEGIEGQVTNALLRRLSGLDRKSVV